MAEFIDRMSVVCAIKKYELEKCPSYKVAWVTRLKLEVTGDLLEDIMGIPAADVVEVVRCKDCKWHDSVDGPTAKIEQLQSELEQVKRERDAAVNEIKACYDIQGIDDYYPIYDLGICMCCSHYSDVVDRANGEELACYDCQNASNWQWHKVKEADHETD